MAHLPTVKDVHRELAALVAFDTTSRGSNLALIAYAEAQLRPLGAVLHRVPNAEGNKASLIATIGPKNADGLVLSGHTDVVPVDGQDWATPPFTLTEKDGKWFGRGTADMKGFLALALAFAPYWAAQPLTRPVHLAFSYDEEVGCLAAPALAAEMRALGLKAALAIIGEPTGMQAVEAHKGIVSFETVVEGLEHHSSAPERGVNAIYYALEMVQCIRALTQEIQEKPRQNTRFDPPYTTLHVGVIEGGTARNIIPRHCRFLWEIRPVPGENVAALTDRIHAEAARLTKEMQRTHPGASITTQRKSNVPGLQADAASPALSMVLHWLGSNQAGQVAFATEAGIFDAAGFPSVICGPGHIAQAHTPNEFIEVAQIEAALGFFSRMGEWLIAQ